MKKKLLCLILAVVFVASLTSCFKGDQKYNYKDMSKYITIADYKNFIAVIEMDTIQATIDSYLMDNAEEYKVQKGDVVTIKLSEVYNVVYTDGTDDNGNQITVDSKGDEIEDLEKEFTVTIGDGKLGEKIEEALIDSKLATSISGKSCLSEDLEIAEYQGKEVYYKAEVTSIDYTIKRGDIVSVEYEGYYIDEDGNILKVEDDDGNEIDKVFNSGTTQAFIGANLAIEDFENGILGMKFGETKIFDATFPEDYNQFDEDGVDLSGKKVKFKCTVKTLYVTPIYNDSFVKDNIDGYETKEDWESALIDAAVSNAINENLQNNSTVISYPKNEYKIAKVILDNNLENYMPYGWMTYEQYLNWFFGMTPTEYLEYQLKSEMIYYTISKAEGIYPTDEAVEEARNEFKEDYIQTFMEENNVSRSVAEQYANLYMDQMSQYQFYDQELFELIDDYLFENTTRELKERTKTSVSQEMAQEQEEK